MWRNIVFIIIYLYICKTIVYSKIITPDDANNLQSAILSAYQNERLDSVTLAPGIYRIPFSDHPNANIILGYLRNFVINADNVTLLMLDNRKRGITFYNCYNVTVRGVMTIRNDIIPFSQGYIESVDKKSFVINIHDGYPTTLDNTTYFPKSSAYYIFDRNTRRLKDQTYDYYNRDIIRIDERRFRVIFDYIGQEIVVGDLVSMRGTGGFGIICEITELMHFIDINIEFSGGIGWFETGGKGNNRYERISVRPGPKPLSATEKPLMSANADGFHSAGIPHGPTIINSFFTRMADDGIAIHGGYQMIRQINENVLICMHNWAGLPYKIGHRVTIVGKDGVPRGQAHVQRIQSLPNDYLSPISSFWPHFQNNHYYFELELDINFNGTISPNDLISNIDSTGSGFVLKENLILDHRARGMLLKAHDGLIQSNLINGSSIAGLVMQPELWWGEANYAERIIIQNNTLMRCGYASTGTWTDQAGVLTIYGTGSSPIAYGHHTITIQNNSFIENDGVQMVFDGLKDTLIKQNIFSNGQNKINNRGSEHGIDGGTLIYINRAQSLILEGNRAWNLGVAHRTGLQITDLATQIIGTQNGIIVED